MLLLIHPQTFSRGRHVKNITVFRVLHKHWTSVTRRKTKIRDDAAAQSRPIYVMHAVRGCRIWEETAFFVSIGAMPSIPAKKSQVKRPGLTWLYLGSTPLSPSVAFICQPCRSPQFSCCWSSRQGRHISEAGTSSPLCAPNEKRRQISDGAVNSAPEPQLTNCRQHNSTET